MKPRVLDLFCGGGGGAMGYHRAGFEVVGVDLAKQPHYPFEFHQGDALEWPLDGFDLIHASPPCQRYSMAGRLHGNGHEHPDLIGPTRERLEASGLPWVIENVVGAPLDAQVVYCGSAFGLRIAKHRLFEANWPLPPVPGPCDHSDLYDPWHGPGRTADGFRAAMGIDWLPTSGGASRKRGETGELSNAIPPPYTEHIGRAWRALAGR